MKRPHYAKCNGSHWWKQRMKALVRDNFTCQWEGSCTEDDGKPETRLRFLVVHHVKYRIHGGTHDLENLVTLCRFHHAKIHPHLRRELVAERKEIEYPTREL